MRDRTQEIWYGDGEVKKWEDKSKENELIIFEAEEKGISLPVFGKNDTVWLSANMIAESNPEEKEMMISVIMNCMD